MLEDAFDPERFRKLGHAAVDQLADALARTKAGEGRVKSEESADEAVEFWRDFEEGDLTDTVIGKAFKSHHPRNLGHQVGPVLPEVAVMDLVGGFLDTGNGVFEVGNPGTPMERVVLQELAERVGFSAEADGILTSGGSLGNLTALLAMRQKMTGSWDAGTEEKYAVLVSAEAHYCVARAAKVMGWGEEGVISVPVDEEYRMDVGAAEVALRNSDRKVIGLVGSAGSTATGRVDRLGALADFCEREELWFHVDAAHSGAFVFSDKARGMLAGMERADSVVIDFHKMLLTSSLVTAVLFKQGGDSYGSFAQKADYLWRENEGEIWWDLARRTMECTRPMLGLRAYAAMQVGRDGLFAEYLDQALAMSEELAAMVREAEDFELLLEPESNIVCYRLLRDGADEEELDALNLRVREALVDEGVFYIVQVEKRGAVWLRSALMNPFVTTEVLAALLERIRRLGSSPEAPSS